MYAFGIVLWELLTWQEPWEQEGLNSYQIMTAVKDSLRPVVPPISALPGNNLSQSAVEDYIGLMQDCWAPEASARPNFETIIQRLKAILMQNRAMSAAAVVPTPHRNVSEGALPGLGHRAETAAPTVGPLHCRSVSATDATTDNPSSATAVAGDSSTPQNTPGPSWLPSPPTADLLNLLDDDVGPTSPTPPAAALPPITSDESLSGASTPPLPSQRVSPFAKASTFAAVAFPAAAAARASGQPPAPAPGPGVSPFAAAAASPPSYRSSSSSLQVLQLAHDSSSFTSPSGAAASTSVYQSCTTPEQHSSSEHNATVSGDMSLSAASMQGVPLVWEGPSSGRHRSQSPFVFVLDTSTTPQYSSGIASPLSGASSGTGNGLLYPAVANGSSVVHSSPVLSAPINITASNPFAAAALRTMGSPSQPGISEPTVSQQPEVGSNKLTSTHASTDCLTPMHAPAANMPAVTTGDGSRTPPGLPPTALQPQLGISPFAASRAAFKMAAAGM